MKGDIWKFLSRVILEYFWIFTNKWVDFWVPSIQLFALNNFAFMDQKNFFSEKWSKMDRGISTYTHTILKWIAGEDSFQYYLATSPSIHFLLKMNSRGSLFSLMYCYFPCYSFSIVCVYVAIPLSIFDHFSLKKSFLSIKTKLSGTKS